MLSYPRKSAQKYAINLTFPKDWLKNIKSLPTAKIKNFAEKSKKVAKKFASLIFCRTFAIPINKAVVVKW